MEVSELDDPMLRERPTLKGENLSPSDRAAILSDSTYWRNLCPWLHVGDSRAAWCQRMGLDALPVMEPSADLVDECRDRMAADGYFTVDVAATDAETGERHLPWAIDVPSLAKGVEAVRAHGWPANFVLVYDEVWLLVHQVRSPDRS